MARGDMLFESVDIGGRVDIMNRDEGEMCTPITIDFTSVTTRDDDTGEKVVRAGMPITEAGVEAKTTPWTGAIGILRWDVYESRPQGSLVRAGFLNKTVAQSNASVTYDSTIQTLLPNIIFETGK